MSLANLGNAFSGAKNILDLFGQIGLLMSAGAPIAQTADQIEDIGKSIKTIFGSMKEESAIKAFKKLGIEGDDLTNILLACGMSADKIEEKLSKLGDKTKFVDKLKTGFKGLADILHTTPKTLLGWTGGITAAVAAVTLLSNVQKKMYENAQDGASAYMQSSASIEDYKSKVEPLITSLENGTLSNQEAYEARQKLLTIQGEVVSAYGTEAAGLDLLTMSATQAANAFDKLAAAQASEYLLDNKTVISNAQKALESVDEYNLGNIWTGVGSPDKYGVIKQRVQEIVDKYEHAYLSVGRDAFGNETTSSIVIKADAEDAKQTILGITTDLQNLKDEAALDGIDLSDMMSIEGFESTAESFLRTINKTLDKYSEIYETANLSKIAEDSTFSELMNDLDNAQEKYGRVMSESYDSEEDRADAVSDSLEEMIALKERFAAIEFKDDQLGVKDIFQGYMDWIDESIRREEFRLDIIGTVNGESPGKFGKGIENYLNAFKDSAGYIDPYEVLNAGVTGKGKSWSDMTAQEQAYVNLKAALSYYNIEVEEAISLMDRYGLIQTKVGKISGAISSSYTTAAEKTKTLTDAISGAQSILNSQKAGFSLSVEDFKTAELNGYSSALEYNNGVLQLNSEKVNELLEAKAKEQIAYNDTQKALAQSEYIENSQEVNRLRKEIKELTDGHDELSDATQKLVNDKNDSIKKLLEENDEIKNVCSKYDLMTASIREATSAYQAWLSAQNAPQSGDMFDGSTGMIDLIKKAFNNPTSEYYNRFNNADFKAAVDFVIPDSVDSTDKAAVNKYMNTIGQLFTTDGSGKKTVNFNNFITKALKAGLMELDAATGEYKVKAGKTIDDFCADLLGDDVELTRAMMESIIGEMEEFRDFFDFEDEAEKTFGDMAVAATEAKEALESLNENSDLEITIDVTDIEGKENQIVALDETISKMQEYKSVNLDPSQIEYANDIIRYCVAQKNLLSYQTILSVDASKVGVELGEAITLMQEYARLQGKLSETIALGGDTSSIQSEIDGVISKLKELGKESNIDLGINLESLTTESLSKYLQAVELPQILLDAGIKPEALSSVSQDVDAKVVFGVDDELVNEFKADDHDIDAALKYAVIETEVNAFKSKNHNLTATLTYITKGDNRNLTQVNGTANASGTAMASGDWGTAPGGPTLTGELGREIVVDPRTGKWFTVGDTGAEFVDIPPDAIVFNHKQSDALLKYGHVAGRGESMASGTAMVTGGISKDFLNQWVHGGSGNIKGDNEGDSESSENKDNESPFEREYKLKQHYLEMEQVSFQDYLDWLEGAYKDAFNNGQIEIEDFYQYEEEVFNGKKELFEDGLNDLEHEIAVLEREGGQQSAIINKYQTAINKINQQIQEARDRGLDDNDDYIQELMQQAWDYEDEIKEIEDDLTESSKDATEELIEYRIDMLKQEIEDEKDALNDKMDALKEFYDNRKEALKEARDEEKYLEEQAEKREAVADIKKELDRLKFDNSAKAEKRKLELQEKLLEAEKELAEFEEDRAYDQTTKLLDEQMEAQEAQIQSEIDKLDEKLNDPEALYNQALADIKNNTYDLYQEMVAYNNKHRSGNPEDVTEMWTNADDAFKAYFKLFGELYKGIELFDITNPPGDPPGYATGTSNAKPGYYELFEKGDEYVYQSKDGRRYKMFSGLGNKVLNATATDFLYKFANGGESLLSNLVGDAAGYSAAYAAQRKIQDIKLSTGDIIIEGNATSATVSEIRRVQRENIDHVLREFTRMNR